MVVGSSSPFPRQACVAAATILGSAVGAWSVRPSGVILGATVGFIIGDIARDYDAVAFEHWPQTVSNRDSKIKDLLWLSCQSKA